MRLRDAVSFNAGAALFPAECRGLGTRVTWQWNRNGTLRARFSEDGALAAFERRGSPGIAVSTQGLYLALGEQLRGHYPLTRIDGTDVYIDIRAAADAPPEEESGVLTRMLAGVL
jgi:hypothetical protein